jgi:hypothetical protein
MSQKNKFFYDRTILKNVKKNFGHFEISNKKKLFYKKSFKFFFGYLFFAANLGSACKILGCLGPLVWA